MWLQAFSPQAEYHSSVLYEELQGTPNHSWKEIEKVYREMTWGYLIGKFSIKN